MSVTGQKISDLAQKFLGQFPFHCSYISVSQQNEFVPGCHVASMQGIRKIYHPKISELLVIFSYESPSVGVIILLLLLFIKS